MMEAEVKMEAQNSDSLGSKKQPGENAWRKRMGKKRNGTEGEWGQRAGIVDICRRTNLLEWKGILFLFQVRRVNTSRIGGESISKEVITRYSV